MVFVICRLKVTLASTSLCVTILLENKQKNEFSHSTSQIFNQVRNTCASSDVKTLALKVDRLSSRHKKKQICFKKSVSYFSLSIYPLNNNK
jgi:hypothetical protein